MNIQGHSAIVTGGASGLGAKVAVLEVNMALPGFGTRVAIVRDRTMAS